MAAGRNAVIVTKTIFFLILLFMAVFRVSCTRLQNYTIDASLLVSSDASACARRVRRYDVTSVL